MKSKSNKLMIMALIMWFCIYAFLVIADGKNIQVDWTLPITATAGFMIGIIVYNVE